MPLRIQFASLDYARVSRWPASRRRCSTQANGLSLRHRPPRHQAARQDHISAFCSVSCGSINVELGIKVELETAAYLAALAATVDYISDDTTEATRRALYGILLLAGVLLMGKLKEPYVPRLPLPTSLTYTSPGRCHIFSMDSLGCICIV